MTDVEKLRYDLGKKARERGEPIHGDASDEFKKGFSRGLGFGSNVTPKNFGKTDRQTDSWTCVCGFENQNNRVARRAGVVVCWKCGTERDYSEDKDGKG